MEGTTKASAEQVEQELEQLLDQELFEPPAEFRDSALISDESIYDEAAQDTEAFWAKQAEALDWSEKWDQVLDESEAPFYKWFVGGKLNASAQCLDRHVDAGRGDRVAFHWRGEEGEERDVTYEELLRDTKRLANVLKERGIEPGDVVGIYLPMIPEVAVAMLACARVGAPHNVVFGGFSPEAVKERMEFSEAKALITVDQARRKGKAADIKPAVDKFLGEVPSIQTVVVVRNTGADVEMEGGRDLFYDEAIEAASDDCPAEAFDAEHPLYV
ncbi:MAG TPA: AMP-binding protein, partial [Thermoleophilaceae bacterium]|nr:AMP-binding protein [Thermoleophilaceae bacterium]